MDDIPEWLLTEVLLRLPVAALYKFKVVCKEWLSLISSPYFLRRYASRGSISPRWVLLSRRIYHCSQRHDIQAPELLMDLHCGDLKCPVPTRPEDAILMSAYRILAASNGLVLYVCRLRDSRNHGLGSIWCVCDPVTRHCVALPPCISEPHELDNFGLLTQMKDGVVTGFTVVKYAGKMSRFEVLSSERGEWRFSSPVYNGSVWLSPTPSTEVGGILHWIVVSSNAIAAYDPHSNHHDQLRLIPLPADRYKSRPGMCGTHDGRLRYLEAAELSLRVWVLNDYGRGDSWLLQHRASNTSILKDVDHDCKPTTSGSKTTLRPISFHPFDPDVVYFTCDGVFLSYNMRERKSQVLKTSRYLRDGRWQWAFCLVIPPLPPSLP